MWVDIANNFSNKCHRTDDHLRKCVMIWHHFIGKVTKNSYKFRQSWSLVCCLKRNILPMLTLSSVTLSVFNIWHQSQAYFLFKWALFLHFSWCCREFCLPCVSRCKLSDTSLKCFWEMCLFDVLQEMRESMSVSSLCVNYRNWPQTCLELSERKHCRSSC